MLNADSRCTLEGREEAQIGREYFMLKLFFLALKCEFLFHHYSIEKLLKGAYF